MDKMENALYQARVIVANYQIQYHKNRLNDKLKTEQENLEASLARLNMQIAKRNLGKAKQVNLGELKSYFDQMKNQQEENNQ